MLSNEDKVKMLEAYIDKAIKFPKTSAGASLSVNDIIAIIKIYQTQLNQTSEAPEIDETRAQVERRPEYPYEGFTPNKEEYMNKKIGFQPNPNNEKEQEQ